MAIHYITLKQCNRKDNCKNPLGSWLPATSDYFYAAKECKDGLRGNCKECHNTYDPDKARDYKRRNADRIAVTRREYRRSHKEEIRLYSKRRYDANPDAYRERSRVYRQNHQDALQDYNRQWKKTHRDELREYERQRRIVAPEIHRKATHMRRCRRRSLPNTLTEQEWQFALEYFNGACAVCGELPGLWNKLARDHWIPVASGGGYTAGNIIPLCHSGTGGEGGCNNAKHKKNPVEWLTERYGKRKAKQINDRIQVYFELVRQREHEPA